MRFQGIISTLLLSVFAGCSSCPVNCGPGFASQSYGSCVGRQAIAPPIPLGNTGSRHRQTLAERKQARDLNRWYKELNHEPRSRRRNRNDYSRNDYSRDDYCPHCQKIHRSRSNGFDDYYDEGMVYGDGYYDGQIIDGGAYQGDFYNGEQTSSYCPDCQNQQHHSQPTMSQPISPQPMMAEPAPAPPAEPVPTPTTEAGTPSAYYNELYSPQPTQQTLPGQIQQVAIPPVEQVLFAPTHRAAQQ